MAGKGFELKLIGVDQARRTLEEMSLAVQKRITRKAVRASLDPIYKKIKGSAYGGDRQKRTGLLQRSIGTSTSTKMAGLVTGKVLARNVKITGKTKVAQLVRAKRRPKANVTEYRAFYWRFLEKGTKKRQTSGGANRGSIGASPWVEPSFDATAGTALERFREVFNRETDIEARKLYTRQGRPR